MKTSFFSILMICFFVTSVFSQTNLNEYKYIIVSKKYDFLKEVDQYQVNSLSKFLFNKYGFEALMEGEAYPEDLTKNRCLALKADALKEPGMFKTKLAIELKDCNDQVVYTSGLGESREKEFKKSYTEAIRNAFKSIEALNYKYEPKENDDTILTSTTEVKNEVAEEIQKLKEEIQTLKQEKKVEVAEVTNPQIETQIIKSPETKPVEQVNTIKAEVKEGLSGVLYAQKIDNGFQLVDSSPKVVYKIIKTGLNNVFLVENQTAIIYKEGDHWILENGSPTKTKLNIKF